jgi:predicted metal-dependent hydrolase
MPTTFPHRERFYINFIKHYHGKISAPILSEQVKEFIGQEAAYRKEHHRYIELIA